MPVTALLIYYIIIYSYVVLSLCPLPLPLPFALFSPMTGAYADADADAAARLRQAFHLAFAAPPQCKLPAIFTLEPQTILITGLPGIGCLLCLRNPTAIHPLISRRRLTLLFCA